jgi:hypothetical protein
LSRNPEFFIANRAEPIDLIVVAGLLTFGVPTVLIALEAALSVLSGRIQQALHAVAIAALTALIVLPVLGSLSLPAVALVVLAGVGGVTFAICVTRFDRLEQFLTFLGPVALIFPLIFLTAEPIRKLLLPAETTVESSATATHSVVFVIFDELPISFLLDEEGELDHERYPSFARLAATSAWHTNAYSVSDYTQFAVPVLLTGQYPDLKRDPTTTDYPESLFTLLGGSWAVRAIESVTMLCPDSVCQRTADPLRVRFAGIADDLAIIYAHVVLPADLTDALPPITHNWANFAEEAGDAQGWKTHWREAERRDRVALFEEFVSGIERDESPTLHFLHTLLPHGPYKYLPSGRLYSSEPRIVGTLSGDKWGADEDALIDTIHRHILQLGYADRLLGKLLDRLEETGNFDDALIVVTADHGIGMQIGDWRRRLTVENAAQISPVPLLIKRPGQKAARTDERVLESVDILPTIAELLGVEVAWEIDGRSYANSEASGRARIRFGRSHNPEPLYFDANDRAEWKRQAQEIPDLFPREPGRAITRRAPSPALAKFIGRPVDEVGVEAVSELELQSSIPSVLPRYDPIGDFVPAHITGTIARRDDGSHPDIAVALNGVIRAVSRAFATRDPDDALRWSVVLDESDFLAGANEIRAYRVGESADGPILEEPADGSRALSSLGSRPVLGVDEDGFYAPSTWGERRVRWTDGDAWLEIPVDRDSPPSGLEIRLASTGSSGGHLEISLNGQSVFSGDVEKGEWSRSFGLESIALGEKLRIEIESTKWTSKPRDSEAEGRILGVAIESIRLLSD